MTTINDQELTEQLVKIHAKHVLLERLEREGNAQALFIALSDIERAANAAQWRLNQLRWNHANQPK